MKRRDFLGAISGSLALSMAGTTAGAMRAQGIDGKRTINETAAERLRKIYSYIPDTPEYEALAVGDALWSDISKQIDAFGYVDQRDDFLQQASRGAVWFTGGNAFQMSRTDVPDTYALIPVLTADQVIQLGERQFPSNLALFIGIDSAIPRGIFQERGYESVSFAGGTVYLYLEKEVDLRKTIDKRNRFAVLLDEGVLAWFDSEKAARDYATWVESGGSSLVDSQAIGRQLELVEPDAITMAWMDGGVFDVRTLDRIPRAHARIAEEEELFGRMPQLLLVSVGINAGASRPNLRNPYEPAPEIVDGYSIPEFYAKLTFLSDDDAYRAADIIEWRLENAPSWRTGEPTNLGSSIDRTEIRDGVLIQRFDELYAVMSIPGMPGSSDLYLYGW